MLKIRQQVKHFFKVQDDVSSLYLRSNKFDAQTCKVGRLVLQAPSALGSCSRTRAAPGAQGVWSQRSPAPGPRLKGDPLSVKLAASLTQRWRASSAGLTEKYTL